MNSNPEAARPYRRIAGQNGLPSAPMAMPEQALVRRRSRAPWMAPLLDWLAWK